MRSGKKPVGKAGANRSGEIRPVWAIAGAVAGVIGLQFLDAAAHGATNGTWAGGANSSWSNSTDWAGGIPTSAGDTAQYKTASAATTTLDSNRTVGQLFDAFSGAWTIAAGGGTLTLDNTGGSAPAVGPAGNSFIGDTSSGSLTVGAPVVIAGADLTIGSSNTGNLSVNDGITGSGNITIDLNAAGSAVFQTGNINASGAITDSGTGAGNATFTSSIGSNVTNVTQAATSSTLILSAANTYTGSTTLSSGALEVGNSTALSAGSVSLNGGTFEASAASLTIGNNLVLGGGGAIGGSNALTFSGLLTNSGANNTLTNIDSGGITLNNIALSEASGAGRSLTLSGTRAITVAGTVSDYSGGTGSVASALVYSGTGGLVLDSADNYTGGTTVNGGGVVTLGNNSSLGTGPVTLIGNGNDLNAISTLAISMANNVTIGASSTVKFETNLGAGGSGSLAINGNLSGSSGSSITFSAGTFYLGGNNSGYSGTISINQGTYLTSLNSGSAAALWEGTNVSGPIYMDAGGGTMSFGALAQSTPLTAKDGKTYTVLVGQAGLTETYAGDIGDVSYNNVNYVEAGAGTQTLTGYSTYSGSTSVESGVLTIGAPVYSTAGIALSGSLTSGNTTITVANGYLFEINQYVTGAGIPSLDQVHTEGANYITLVTAPSLTQTSSLSTPVVVGAVGTTGASGSITLGDAVTGSLGLSATLLNAGYTIDRAIVVTANPTAGVYAIGGSNTSGVSLYAGAVTLNEPTTLLAATGGVTDFNFLSGSWNTNSNAITVNNLLNGGTVEIDNAMTDAGGITVAAGMLNLTNTFTGNASLSSGAALLGGGTVAGMVTLNGSNTLSNTATLSATSLIVTGSGNAISSGTFTTTSGAVIGNSGNASISGSLAVTGTLGGTLNIYTGTLTGTGAITGLVTTHGGSVISPAGAGTAGTLTMGNGLNVGPGDSLVYDLNGASTTTGNDLVSVTGPLTLTTPSGGNSTTGDTIAFNSFTGGAPLFNQAYALISYTGAFSGTPSNLLSTGAPAHERAVFTNTGTALDATFELAAGLILTNSTTTLAASNYTTAYSGTPTPPGSGASGTITISGGSGSYKPGYLDAIGGQASQAADQNYVTIDNFDSTGPEIIALHVNITDSANPSNGNATILANDLSSVINDLAFGAASGITVESFSALGSSYGDAAGALSADEPADGLPFNIAIIDANGFSPGSPLYLGLNFTNETGDDGTITNVQVTDIGVVPEPASAAMLAIGAVGALIRRRRGKMV